MTVVSSVDEEIEACIRGEYPRLVHAVALVTGSNALAQECVQEAFARAWERSRRGERFEHLAGWVATVALNLARSGRRRAAAEQRAVERLGRRIGPHAQPDPDAALSAAVRAAVDGLAPRQRDAVLLYYVVDLDVRTVASVLGVSDGTVKTALSRARHHLARLLDDEEREA